MDLVRPQVANREKRNPMRYICTAVVATLVLTYIASATAHTMLANSCSFYPDTLDVAASDTIVGQYSVP